MYRQGQERVRRQERMRVAQRMMASLPKPSGERQLRSKIQHPHRLSRQTTRMMRNIAKALDVSLRTLIRWDKAGYEVRELDDPPLPRNIPPALSCEEKELLAGYVLDRYLHNEGIDGNGAKEFLRFAFNKEPSLPVISRALNNHRLACKNTRHYVPQFDRAAFLADHRKVWDLFQAHLTSHRWAVFFDETAFYLSRGRQKAYGPIGG